MNAEFWLWFILSFSGGTVIVLVLSFRKQRKQHKVITETLLKEGYPPWAEILPGLPKKELREQGTSCLALLLFGLAVGAAISMTLTGRANQPGAKAVIVGFIWGFLLFVAVLAVALSLYLLGKSLVGRFGRGETLLDLGPNPYHAHFGGLTRLAAFGMILGGVLALVNLRLEPNVVENLLGFNALAFGLFMLMANTRSLISERGLFLQGFLYPWEKIRWFRWHPSRKCLVYSTRPWHRMFPHMVMHVPSEFHEQVRSLIENRLQGKEEAWAADQKAAPILVPSEHEVDSATPGTSP